MILLVTRADVGRLLTMDECIVAVEEAFRLHGERAVPTPGVLGTHVPGGGFHVKTGAMPFDGRLHFAAKINANFPDNPAMRALPTIQGALVLFDAEGGVPLAVMDSIEITRLRTAAATAVAARRLARAESATLTVIGCGLQGHAQAEALLAVLPIATIYAFDIDPRRAAAFVAAVGPRPGLVCAPVDDFREASRRSDVVVTCTTSTVPFLSPGDVGPGTFVAAVGADGEHKQELDPRLLVGSHLVTDVREQAAAIGELHHAIERGLLGTPATAAELGAIVAGREPGRREQHEIAIFDSTGMALQDVAAACAIYRKACRESGVLRVPLND